ncbi:MAG: 2-C-methyl-D-erythritol 4-phosphate cytidylyltransferase [Roseburia sp. CAG:10041_57]|nr:MAG: 2-C-methyl-D-erythritol 4-phosphate cytidylyltransferase [Roseburia sp. CAG:10041_57]
MNIAVIFAGGSGQRMHSRDIPKQFLEMHGKPIIIYTLELFEKHPEIDAIVIACKEDWIEYLEKLLYKYRIEKVKKIVPGGDTGQMSIYNGLMAAQEVSNGEEAIVLIHDGVRPLINQKVISDNIESVKIHGSAITTAIVKETILVVNDGEAIINVPDRAKSRVAKAPQSFWLKDILAAHNRAQKEGMFDCIDSCTMMKMYGYPLYLVDGPYENIKITTPDDFYTMRALLDAQEDEQLYRGL